MGATLKSEMTMYHSGHKGKSNSILETHDALFGARVISILFDFGETNGGCLQSRTILEESDFYMQHSNLLTLKA